jgi:hypothetical protein
MNFNLNLMQNLISSYLDKPKKKVLSIVKESDVLSRIGRKTFNYFSCDCTANDILAPVSSNYFRFNEGSFASLY